MPHDPVIPLLFYPRDVEQTHTHQTVGTAPGFSAEDTQVVCP